MELEWWEVGCGILFNKDASEIKKELSIDLSSSRNSVIMCKGRSGDGGELVVISVYDDFAIAVDLGAPFSLLRGG